MGNTGGTECAVDIGDVSTDAIGNILLSAAAVAGELAEATNGTTWTYWAHTGAVGAAYDNDSPSNSVAISSSTAAAVTTCTDSVSTKAAVGTGTPAGGDLVPYGTTVTITCQLEVSTASGTDVAMALSKVIFVDTMKVATDDGAGIDSDSALAASSVVTTTSYTDATGAVTYTLTAADPLATDYLQRTEHVVTVTPAITGTKTFTILFDDNVPLNQTVTMALGSTYGAGAATGVSRTATATVRDQYGNGMASKTVTFESSSTNGATDPFTDDVTRVTDSSGVATLGYTSVQTASAALTVYGWLDNGLTKDGALSGTASDGTNDTPGAGGELDGNASFYRTTAQVSSVTEVDTAPAAEVGGEGFGIAVDVDGAWTVTSHGLEVGDEVLVRSQATDPRLFLIGSRFFVITVTDANTLEFSATRGGTIVKPSGGAIVTGGGTDLEVAATGKADFAADVLMELVVDDTANNTLVINHLAGAAATSTFVTFAYDSNDQFQTLADLQSPTTATMAAFETAVTGKFTLGVPTAGMNGDVYSLSYQATTDGIQLVQLGQ